MAICETTNDYISPLKMNNYISNWRSILTPVSEGTKQRRMQMKCPLSFSVVLKNNLD